jgi:hypothetical protein
MKPIRYILDKMERNDDGVFAERVGEAIDSMSDKRGLNRALLISGSINFVVWLMVLLFPRDVRSAFNTVGDVQGKIIVVVIGFLFGIGFFFAYALLRLKFPDVETGKMDDGPMSSFNYHAHSQKRWLVWLFATIGGVVNVFLLIVVDIGMSGH